MTVWYENGQKFFEGKYVDNRKHEKWTQWYVQGQKWKEENYWLDKKEGKQTTWHLDETIEIENFKDGKLL